MADHVGQRLLDDAVDDQVARSIASQPGGTVEGGVEPEPPQVLDERGGEFFDWPSQIRPFTPSPVTDVAAPDSDVPGGNVTHYRLTFPTGGVLRQVELLA